jgi:hypothetical protein
MSVSEFTGSPISLVIIQNFNVKSVCREKSSGNTRIFKAYFLTSCSCHYFYVETSIMYAGTNKGFSFRGL